MLCSWLPLTQATRRRHHTCTFTVAEVALGDEAAVKGFWLAGFNGQSLGFDSMRRFLSAAFHRVTGLFSTHAAAPEGVAVPGKFQEYKAKAEQGNAEAQFNLGFCYDDGRGVAKNYAKAAKWYRKAAEQGHTQAQFNLGYCYVNGQGVGKDKVEGYAWFSMAAKADSDAAKSRALLRKELTPQQFTDAQKRMKELHWQIVAKSRPSTP